MSDWERADISEMVGRVFTSVEVTGHGEILTFEPGFRMLHHQDCCESVSIEEIIGDLSDLVGVPIVVAEERVSQDADEYDGSVTWTFYEFRTIKGSVTIRWCGSSNGYYSEAVDLERIPDDKIILEMAKNAERRRS